MDQTIPNTPPVASVPPAGDNSANTIKPPIVGFTPPAPAGGSNGGMKFGFKKFNPKFAILILVVLMGVIGLTAYIVTTQKTVIKSKATSCDDDSMCDEGYYCSGGRGGNGTCVCRHPNEDGSCGPVQQGDQGWKCSNDGQCSSKNSGNTKPGAEWVCNGNNADGCQQVCPAGSHWVNNYASCESNSSDGGGGNCTWTKTMTRTAQCSANRKADVTFSVTNNCSQARTLNYSRGEFGPCVYSVASDYACGKGCGGQEAASSESFAPNETKDISASCEVPANVCGMCQVDLTVDGQKGGAAAENANCTQAGLSCTSVTMTGSTNVTTTEKTKQFTVTVAGGKTPYHVTWIAGTPPASAVGSLVESGTFSPATCDITTPGGTCTTTWTAPTGEPIANHSWIISPRITDAANTTIQTQAVAACTKNLSVVVSTNIACSGIAVSPNSATITSASETRTLTPTVTGTTNYTVTWAQTGGSTAPSSADPKVGVWTAPSSLPSSTTSWTVTATVAGAGQSANCTATFSYTPVNNYSYKTCENNACVSKDCNPRTTDCSRQSTCSNDNDCKQTYQYKTCENYACKTKDCNPKTIACASSNDCRSDDDCKTTTHKICRNEACVSVSGAGSDQCSSDVSCRTAAVPPPIPTSGITTPTVITIGTGVILTILGAILLL